jgi:hypothetical protein
MSKAIDTKAGGLRSARRLSLVVLALALALAQAAPADTAPEPKKDPDTVSITADQMHQVSIVDVKACTFNVQKLAIG